MLKIPGTKVTKSHIFYKAIVADEKMINFSQIFKYRFIYKII